jgi:hypothetical protein
MTLTGGAIRFDNLPNGGSFTTYGGEIDIGAVSGNARFATGGGNVRIMNASGDLSVATGVGSVEIGVIGAGARNISVATSSGRAVIELPANIDARLDIESGYTGPHAKTEIESDFPVNRSEREDRNGNGTPRWYVTASGNIGSGRGLIKIRTMNGDVVIRRRQEEDPSTRYGSALPARRPNRTRRASNQNKRSVSILSCGQEAPCEDLSVGSLSSSCHARSPPPSRGRWDTPPHPGLASKRRASAGALQKTFPRHRSNYRMA